MNADQVRRRLRALAERAGSITALSTEMGVSRNYLSMTMSGARVPDGKVLKFMGLRREITFVKEEVK